MPTIVLNPTAGTDDATESPTGFSGAVFTGESVILLDHGDANQQRVGGFRFVTSAIPQGAVINACNLTLTANNPGGNWNFIGTVHFQKSASPAPFAAVNFNISSRPKTAASVFWDSGPWPHGTSTTTPSLVAPLQEVVNSFTTTAFVIILTSQIGGPFRSVRARAFESGGAIASLSITFSVPLPTITLSGSIISTGLDEEKIRAGGETLIMTMADGVWDPALGGNNSITQDLIGGLVASNGFPSPEPVEGEPNGWNKGLRAALTFNDVVRNSAAVVTITLPAFPAFEINVQETVTVTVPDSAHDGAGAITAPPGSFNVAVTLDNVMDLIILQGADDGWEDSVPAQVAVGGGSNLVRSDTNAGNLRKAFFRFIGLFPPQGSIITAAFVTVPNAEPVSGGTIADLHFEKAAAPLALPPDPAPDGEISARIANATTSSTPFNISIPAFPATQQSPSLVAPLQEIFDNFSPTALALLFVPRNIGASQVQILSFEGATGPPNLDLSLATKLHIEWTPPVPVGNQVIIVS